MKRGLKHNYRVSAYEDKIIRNKAALAKTFVAAYVRKAALDKDIIVIDGLRELLPKLHAIGNNLNQQTVIMRLHDGQLFRYFNIFSHTLLEIQLSPFLIARIILND